MNTFSIGSSDDTTLSVTRGEAAMSVFMDANIDFDDPDTLMLPYPSDVVSKVVEYMKHHVSEPVRDIKKPLSSRVFMECVPVWDAVFTDVDKPLLFAMWDVSNYLELTGMLNLCSARIAHNLVGMTTQEMRDYLGRENDFTPEEELEARKKTAWFKDTYE
jgi:S-phase kinase-associated protein 1